MSMLRPSGEDPAVRLARSFSRRRFLDRTLRGVTAGAAGLLTGGSIFAARAKADAETECFCAAPRGIVCTDCPPGRGKQRKCPTGYARCVAIDGIGQCPGCVYETGYWVSCTGLGQGFGYRICIDCWIPGDCETTCGCRSRVICKDCTSAADVKREMALAALGDD